MTKTKELMEVYNKLLKHFGSQGWWPLINDKTLLSEYHVGSPKNNAQRWEIIVGCVLAQNTNWYPNVVRALQQLKLGRPFKPKELEVIKQAEIIQAQYLKEQRSTESTIMTHF